MRVVTTVVAAMWLAVAASTATWSPPNRCCPSTFAVDPNPPDYHFRCEVANLTDGCDNVTMTEFVPNTAIDTEGETVCLDKTFIMTDWNWEDLEPFEPNVACAYYLPPVEGCCWDVWLVKDFDPIVCGDNCQCDCEDNVCFEEDESITKTYCDSDGGTPQSGWCWPPVGPHNVYGTIPFFTDVNTSLLTTFRSDNINGAGLGGLVFAYALPCGLKRSVDQLEAQSVWAPSQKLSEHCRKEYARCLTDNRRCDMSRECRKYIKIVQYITRTLYAIFSDETKVSAEKNYESPYGVLRKAARHAIRNVKKYGRPTPSITQLKVPDEEWAIVPSTTQTREDPATDPTPSHTTPSKIKEVPIVSLHRDRTQKDSTTLLTSRTSVHRPTEQVLRPTNPPKITTKQE